MCCVGRGLAWQQKGHLAKLLFAWRFFFATREGGQPIHVTCPRLHKVAKQRQQPTLLNPACIATMTQRVTGQRFRQRKLSTKQNLPVLREHEIDQLVDDDTSRHIPKVETGVEKGEEIVSLH